MEDVKNPLASKTVWGAVVALLATLAPILLDQIGVKDADAQAGIWNDLVAAAGAAYAIYGRLVASKVIG
jgi:hypothetical protein